jgi:hypothetical protein
VSGEFHANNTKKSQADILVTPDESVGCIAGRVAAFQPTSFSSLSSALLQPRW